MGRREGEALLREKGAGRKAAAPICAYEVKEYKKASTCYESRPFLLRFT